MSSAQPLLYGSETWELNRNDYTFLIVAENAVQDFTVFGMKV
jgi:hypothetical protein